MFSMGRSWLGSECRGYAWSEPGRGAVTREGVLTDDPIRQVFSELRGHNGPRLALRGGRKAIQMSLRFLLATGPPDPYHNAGLDLRGCCLSPAQGAAAPVTSNS